MKITIKGTECEIQEGNVIRKWSPVLEQLHRVDMNKKDIVKFMSLYAEISSMTNQQLNPEDGNLLPMSMKLLSKLNLEGKELILTTNENHVDESTSSIDMTVPQEEKEREKLEKEGMIFMNTYNILSESEDKLINLVADNINNQLVNSKKFILHTMCSYLSIMTEDGKSTMNLKSKYKIE